MNCQQCYDDNREDDPVPSHDSGGVHMKGFSKATKNVNLEKKKNDGRCIATSIDQNFTPRKIKFPRSLRICTFRPIKDQGN